MAEVKDVDPKLWDSFVELSEQGTIFCKSAWLSLFNTPFKIYGYFKGYNLLGGICGFERLNGTTFDSGCKVLLTPFQGILTHLMPNAKKQAVETMHHEIADALLDQLKYEHIGISNHYTYQDIRPFTWRKFEHIIRYTYIIDVGDLDKLWTDLEKQTRYEINRDTSVIGQPKLEDFDRLYTLTFQRKELERPLSSEFIFNLAQKFPHILLGTEKSMVYFIWDNKRAYYILGASDGTGSAKVLWEGLKKMNELGYKEVDCVGCNSREVGRFKRGFGGRLTPYYCATRSTKI